MSEIRLDDYVIIPKGLDESLQHDEVATNDCELSDLSLPPHRLEQCTVRLDALSAVYETARVEIDWPRGRQY